MKTKTVKIGDMIRSYNVTMPVDPSRGGYLGTVTKIEVAPADGVEYVYYTPICEIDADGTLQHFSEGFTPPTLRAPQNNTPALFDRFTDGIVIVTAWDAAEAAEASQWRRPVKAPSRGTHPDGERQ